MHTYNNMLIEILIPDSNMNHLHPEMDEVHCFVLCLFMTRVFN